MTKKKLTKSNKNIVLTGTLAGIERYTGIGPTVIRVLYVLLSLAAFESSITLYILLALIIPSTCSARANYGHSNAYYEKSNYREQVREQTKEREEAEKTDDDEWSDS